MPFAAGRTLGRYTVTKLLRDGHAAESYQGTADGQTFQIKLFKSGIIDAASLPAFTALAQQLAAAGSPHLVPLSEVSFGPPEAPDRALLARPWVEGRSLGEIMARIPVMQMGEVTNLAQSLLKAVEDVHRRGLTVQSLRPSNIIWATDGVLRLTDAGFWLEDESDAAMFQYLAPEQQAEGPGSVRADLYSVGVVLYRALTGSLPFPASAPQHLLEHKRSGNMASIPRGSRLMVRLVTRLLVADQARRPESAAATLAELDVDGSAKAAPTVADLMPAAPPPPPAPTLAAALPAPLPAPPAHAVTPAPSRPAPPPAPAAATPESLRDDSIDGSVEAPAEAHKEYARSTPAPSAPAPAATPAAGAAPSRPSARAAAKRKQNPALIALACVAVLMMVALSLKPKPGAQHHAPVEEPPPPSESSPPPPPTLAPSVAAPVPSKIDDSPVPFAELPDAQVKVSDESGQDSVVHVRAFKIELYEVTNSRFVRFVTATRYRGDQRWRAYATPGREQHPVRAVTWVDANAFCKWAGRRLPTSAEWEYAARGTDGRTYPWGEQAPEGATPVAPPGTDTRPVGSFKDGVSPCGAFDMAGNVWEWTADREGTTALVRGGCYATPLAQLAIAGSRDIRPTKFPQADCGFRCARD